MTGSSGFGAGLTPLGGDVALRVDGARAALQDDLFTPDLLRQAVPVGVGLAIGEQDRRAQRVPMSALDEKTDDAGPLRLPGGIEHVWRRGGAASCADGRLTRQYGMTGSLS